MRHRQTNTCPSPTNAQPFPPALLLAPSLSISFALLSNSLRCCIATLPLFFLASLSLTEPLSDSLPSLATMNREFYDPKYIPEESEAEWSECNSDFTLIYKKRVPPSRAKPPKLVAAPPKPATPPAPPAEAPPRRTKRRSIFLILSPHLAPLRVLLSLLHSRHSLLRMATLLILPRTLLRHRAAAPHRSTLCGPNWVLLPRACRPPRRGAQAARVTPAFKSTSTLSRELVVHS